MPRRFPFTFPWLLYIVVPLLYLAQLLSPCLSYLHFGLHFKADWLPVGCLGWLFVFYSWQINRKILSQTEGANVARRLPLKNIICRRMYARRRHVAPFGNWGSRGLFNRGVDLQMSPSDHFSCLSHEHNQISAHRVQITEDSQTNIHSASWWRRRLE